MAFQLWGSLGALVGEELRTATARRLEQREGVISSKQPGCAGFHLRAFCTVTRGSFPPDIFLTKWSTLPSPPSPKA